MTICLQSARIAKKYWKNTCKWLQGRYIELLVSWRMGNNRRNRYLIDEHLFGVSNQSVKISKIMKAYDFELETVKFKTWDWFQIHSPFQAIFAVHRNSSATIWYLTAISDRRSVFGPVRYEEIRSVFFWSGPWSVKFSPILFGPKFGPSLFGSVRSPEFLSETSVRNSTVPSDVRYNSGPIWSEEVISVWSESFLTDCI